MSSAKDIVWTDVNLEPLARGTGSEGMMIGGISAETDADIENNGSNKIRRQRPDTASDRGESAE